MIAWGGNPVGAVLGGLLAELLPIRLTFGLLTVGVAVGAALAGWSCLGSGRFLKSRSWRRARRRERPQRDPAVAAVAAILGRATGVGT
jgi:hypothetical protein